MKKIGFPMLLTALLLSGCGFHLRGMINKESIRWLNNIAIVIEQAHRDLDPLLKEQLKAYRIEVNPDPAAANYLLIIENETMEQNISSISSSTTPRQYQLIYTIAFKLQHTQGADILPTSRVVVNRQITLNSNRILGSTDEEALQKEEMRRDAVIQILNRLSRIPPSHLHVSPKLKHHAH